MHTTRFIAPFLILSFASCAKEPGMKVTSGTRPLAQLAGRYGRSASAKLDIDLDVIQRTCALYVAVRSHALKERIAFGRDMDDPMVRWNVCPGGNMVACAVAPTVNGDTVVTGIPWAYASDQGQ